MKLFIVSKSSEAPAFWGQIYEEKIKSSLYSWYYAKACNERRHPSPRLPVYLFATGGNNVGLRVFQLG